MIKSNDQTWLHKHLAPLLGQKVKGIVIDESLEKEFGQPVYGLQFSNGIIMLVLQDPEGNGPGHLELITPNELLFEAIHGNKTPKKLKDKFIEGFA